MNKSYAFSITIEPSSDYHQRVIEQIEKFQINEDSSSKLISLIGLNLYVKHFNFEETSFKYQITIIDPKSVWFSKKNVFENSVKDVIKINDEKSLETMTDRILNSAYNQLISNELEEYNALGVNVDAIKLLIDKNDFTLRDLLTTRDIIEQEGLIKAFESLYKIINSKFTVNNKCFKIIL